ncbi:hypothetical protein BVG16_12895 [Paenibacillus selenitireducens]|uniref:Intracellular proteinase inhibitor BsuPI domain-containing protein n=1 Tax=Paenibacillus selenitireducens TaxID=1324314 RepID=A0A1T2XGD3_9BACL|nr:hypothetical protein [Paenibacillus selenitireducens]OPA78736.1 hypothetical protein BVG16_12895 [Paenibacillus selenitireducens]
MKKLMIIILALLGLVACDKSSQSEEQITVNRDIPKDQAVITTVPAPEEDPFLASISVPNQIKSNEEFVIKATLKNLSDNDLTILHASGVFYLSIKDTNGKGVNTFVMAEVGKYHLIQGKGMITEQYVYKIEKPGVYEVSAIARFSNDEGDNKKDIEVETNKASFEVVLLNERDKG